MIHCYAAWFCQGGLARTLLQALWLVGPWVTRSCWESWDVRHDSEESNTNSAMMRWGYRTSIWIGSCWRDSLTSLQIRKKMSQVLGYHCWRKLYHCNCGCWYGNCAFAAFLLSLSLLSLFILCFQADQHWFSKPPPFTSQTSWSQ